MTHTKEHDFSNFGERKQKLFIYVELQASDGCIKKGTEMQIRE